MHQPFASFKKRTLNSSQLLSVHFSPNLDFSNAHYSLNVPLLKFHFSPNVHFPRNEFFSASFVLKVSRWESCFIKGGSRLSSPLSSFNWKLPSTFKLRLWLWGSSIHIMLQLKHFHWEQRWIWKLETWTQFEIVTRSFTYCTKTTWWDKEWRMGHFKL